MKVKNRDELFKVNNNNEIITDEKEVGGSQVNENKLGGEMKEQSDNRTQEECKGDKQKNYDKPKDEDAQKRT